GPQEIDALHVVGCILWLITKVIFQPVGAFVPQEVTLIDLVPHKPLHINAQHAHTNASDGENTRLSARLGTKNRKRTILNETKITHPFQSTSLVEFGRILVLRHVWSMFG